MGTFNTKRTLHGDPSLIPAMAERICQEFEDEGYQVKHENLISGGSDISVTKGGIFKAALGMKTALKITLVPQSDSIAFEAGVGIFGQQVVPTVIMWFFAWPVLITQIWGMVQQAKLDDKALAIAREVLRQNGFTTTGYNAAPSSGAGEAAAGMKFCTNCGTKVPESARFCPNCGNQL